MSLTASEPDTRFGLPRSRRAIVVVDVVESVRLMRENEADVIDRWRRFVNEVRSRVLPAHGGRLVKSLGDGLLLTFDRAPPAVVAALEMQLCVESYNLGRDASAALSLRVGVHVDEVVVDELDIYGSGVNLAARLAASAGAGETVVSAPVRDALADGQGCQVVDLGELFLKHYASPVRAFRVATAGAPLERSAVGAAVTRPSLAVVPFARVGAAGRGDAIGDALADDVIAALSQSAALRVISRLSTRAFRHAPNRLDQMRALLGVAYVLTGKYQVHGVRVSLQAQLCDARDGSVLWADGMTARVADIFDAQDPIVPAIARHVGKAVLKCELARARGLPIGNLDDYTLYVAGVSMLHRLARADFERAKGLLEHLCERHPRSASPYAMLAKWHVLRRAQGWAPDAQMAGREAQYFARRALALDPAHALALSMDAAMVAQLEGDLDRAKQACEEAILADPQEPHAWLTLGGIHSYAGEPVPAEALPQRAIELSPLDPARFLFDTFLAAGMLSAGKFREAEQAALDSIRLNAMHAPSYRLLTISLALSGKIEAAKEAARQMMRIDPGFRLAQFAQRYPGRGRPGADRQIQALRDAGVAD